MIEAGMRNSTAYMDLLAKKAKEWNVTLDAMIRIDANFINNKELLQKSQSKKH